jgi:DNA-binding NtrC family response regulator
MLLRSLAEGAIRPVGAIRASRADVRMIAATHRDLARWMREERFREDLYYRLRRVVLTVPSLRERAEDLPLLVEHFRRRVNAHYLSTVIRKRWIPDVPKNLAHQLLVHSMAARPSSAGRRPNTAADKPRGVQRYDESPGTRLGRAGADRHQTVSAAGRNFRVFTSPATHYHLAIEGVTPGALRRLTAYRWPGNVCELEAKLKEAMILKARGWLRPEDFTHGDVTGRTGVVAVRARVGS